jgi:hypothetical protein
MSNELQDFVAGCAGGVLQVVSGHPLDTLKVRLQTQAAGGPQFNGMMDCLRKTVASEGVCISALFYSPDLNRDTGCRALQGHELAARGCKLY